jgi:hypothetical protein
MSKYIKWDLELFRKFIQENSEGDILQSDKWTNTTDYYDILCGRCNKIYSIKAYKYTLGGQRCFGCSHKEGGKKRSKKCAEESNLKILYPEIAKEWSYNKNNKLPEDYSYGSHEKVYWICPMGHPDYPAHIHSRTINNRGCPLCGREKAKKTFRKNVSESERNITHTHPELIMEWCWEKNIGKNPNEYTEKSTETIWWKCLAGHNHDDYPALISVRTGGHGCPKCMPIKILLTMRDKNSKSDFNISILYPFLVKEWDFEKNGNKRPEEYTNGSNEDIWWKCPNGHQSYLSRIADRCRRGSGCPLCNIVSHGEDRIKEYLNLWNINFNNQHRFEDCKYKYKLAFDFFISDINVAVEYQGEGHYFPVDFAGKGKEWAEKEFNKNQIRDQIKRDYCHANNIKLLEIPYWDFERIPEILTQELSLN